MFVTGPQIVIYRDGTVFAQIQEDRVADGRVPYHMAMGRLSKSQLSILATDASALPSRTSVSGPVDALADQLTFGGQTWEVPTWETEDPTLEPLLSFVGALRETVHSVAITECVPERWIVRPYGEPSCTVAARPMQPLDYYEAAVYPHLLDRFPIGPFDCYQ